MTQDDMMKAAPAVGVVIGLVIHQVWQSRKNAQMVEKISALLAANESMALPDIVTGVGLKDGFLNRGKVLSALNPMVARGELTQEEPPGTTFKNRLDVLRFRRKV